MGNYCKDWLYHAIMNVRNRAYRIHDLDHARRLGVRIFVVQHKPDSLPSCFNSPIYEPIQVGSAINPRIEGIRWHDDTGDNISKYNLYLNEMTGIYWLYRHYDEIGNPSYIGIDHYRRFLEWDERKLAPGVIFASSYTTIQGVREYFERSLGNMHEAFEAFFAAIRNDPYFARYTDLDEYCRGHFTYCCNLFLTDRETFFKYGDFAEHCLKVCMKLIDSNSVGVLTATRFTDQRKFSYLMEFMTGYWIWRSNKTKSENVLNARKRLLP